MVMQRLTTIVEERKEEFDQENVKNAANIVLLCNSFKAIFCQ